jgi:hypothetical protein
MTQFRIQLSSSAKAGDPVRRCSSVQALTSLEYWIARTSRAMTALGGAGAV